MSVASDYGAMARRYAAHVADELAEHPAARIPLDQFTEHVGASPGRVVDIGCGVGHISAHLRGAGLNVVGFDLTPEMLTEDRSMQGGVPVGVADTRHLPLADGSVAGVVSRFVIIHLPPDQLARAFVEFSRVLENGGHLLLSFFAAGPDEHGATFDHKVSLAYRWGPEQIHAQLADVGLTTISSEWHEPDASRRFPSADVIARRNDRR